jgi:secreted Zn-dependent insulinase-like peptidase
MLPANEIHIIEESLQNKTESNEAVFVSFQHSKLTVKEELLLKLSESLLKDPAFDYLRTQSQLGYVVLMMAEDYRGVGALSLLVQSSTKTSHELIGYIDSFLESKAKDICEGLSQEVFDHYKSALLTVKAEKDKNMKAETSRYWSEIVKHRYIFDRKQQELDTLAGITLPDLK